MIYIIDDKESRQRDFGWNAEKLNDFHKFVLPIREIGQLNSMQDDIIKEGNVVLFHESFPHSDKFKRILENNSENLFIAYFSGSKGARFISENGKKCMLPPDVLYTNLEFFLKKAYNDEVQLRYLAFGENYGIENSLRRKMIEVNKQNTEDRTTVSCGDVFFAVTSDDLEVEPPFRLEIQESWKNWDYFEKDISDVELDDLIHEWFLQKKFETIYIPLCFGYTLSDFLGLRLAMHIRLTQTINQFVPIYIYGVAKIEEISHNYCFDILKSSSVKLIGCDNASFINSNQEKLPFCDLKQDLEHINLVLPHNLGRHSMANQWGADILYRIAFCEEINNEILTLARKSLYFKYVLYKTGNHGSFVDHEEINVVSTSGKKILLIDDEANKGWEQILSKLCKTNIITFNHRIENYKELPQSIRNKIAQGFYDLIFLDLRINGMDEEEYTNPKDFSGMKILQGIKDNLEGIKGNKGNQVIMLTASNKAWNMRALLDAGADAYYIKESPEYMFSSIQSKENANRLIDDINRCFSRCYLRDIYSEISNIVFKEKRFKLPSSLKNSIIKQFEMSYVLISKANSKEEFALSYIALERNVELITKEFIREIRISDVKQYEMKYIKEPCKVFTYSNDECKITSDIWSSTKDYPQWMRIASVYYEIFKGTDPKFGRKMKNYIDKRNEYIHPSNPFKEKHKDIYTENAYIDLFECLFDLIDIM